MTLPTTQVKFRLFRANGAPVEGASIAAKLTRPDTDSGEVIADLSIKGRTDIAGEATLALWPNSRGTTASQYTVTITKNGATADSYLITVPETSSVVLVEDIKSTAPYPAVDAAQLALEAAQQAVVDASDASRLTIGVVTTGEAAATITGTAGSQVLNLVIPDPGSATAATNLAYTASPTGGTVTSDTGTDATLTLADATNAGLMAPAQHSKLSGIAAGATAVTVDAAPTDGSSNAVSSNGVFDALAGKSDTGHNHSGAYQPLATVLTNTTASFTSAQETKLGHISVTQAVDLDAIESRVNELDAAVVLKGVWDASAGTFPGAGVAQAGWSYIVSVAGTVGGTAFAIGDRAIAITDNASTSTFAGNWFKADYTDQVLSVAGRTGAVTLTSADLTDTTAAGRALLDDADAAAQRTTLGLGDSATKSVGTGAGTVCAGDDSRLSDSRTPTAHTHALADLTQSSASTGQVATWNGSAWAPATPSAGGGGAGATNLAYTASPTGGTVTSDTGTDATLTLADGTNAGLMAPAQHTKLAGIAAGATAVTVDAAPTDGSSNAVSSNGVFDALAGKSDTSHNHTGTYDPAGTAASAVSAHAGASDPHGDRAFATSAASTAQSNAISTASGDATTKANAAQAAAIAASTPAAHAGSGGTAHANAVAAGAAGFMTGSDKTKLDGIAAGAQVNPASTDAVTEGSTNLYHTASRVLGQVLTGLSTAAGTVVEATHTILQAIGFLQKQVSDNTTAISGKQATLVSGTNIKTINSSSLLGSGDLTVSASPGGSTTQVQFNDGGALAGSTNFTYDSTNKVLSVETATFRKTKIYLDANYPEYSGYSGVFLGSSSLYGNAGFLVVAGSRSDFRPTNASGSGTGKTASYWLSDNTGLWESSSGVAEINNNSAGTYRDLKLRNLIATGGVVTLASFTVATLPSASTSGAGAMAYVTDSDAAGFMIGATVAGGGSDKVTVTSDGTNWIITG